MQPIPIRVHTSMNATYSQSGAYIGIWLYSEYVSKKLIMLWPDAPSTRAYMLGKGWESLAGLVQIPIVSTHTPLVVGLLDHDHIGKSRGVCHLSNKPSFL